MLAARHSRSRASENGEALRVLVQPTCKIFFKTASKHFAVVLAIRLLRPPASVYGYIVLDGDSSMTPSYRNV